MVQAGLRKKIKKNINKIFDLKLDDKKEKEEQNYHWSNKLQRLCKSYNVNKSLQN